MKELIVVPVDWGVADMTRKMPPVQKWIVRIGFAASAFILGGMLR